MSAANAIFSVAALVFSFIAILISAISARRQTIDARRGNVISFLTELAQRARSQDFRKAEDYVLTQLSQFDPAVGVYGLPEPACDYALLVGGFYQDVGVLVVTGVLDEDLAVGMYYSGIKEVWRALEPFILSEREIRRLRGAGSFFGSFEHIAVYTESVPHEQVRQKFLRRSFPATEPDPAGKVSNAATAQGDVSQPRSSEGG
jgi:hypothetical protein